ncbi:MAG TPA: chromophore lyase CpcT/CpeT [Steroidobacteraceae bacterium]
MARGRAQRNGFAVVLAVAVVTLGGCATPQSSKEDAQEVQLESWLLGHYDNRAQVATDRKHGGYVHPAVSAVISRVDSLMVGEHVLYMQLADTNDPTHITEQFIISFEVVKDKIIETVWAFSEPKRWKNGADTPELFSSLQPADLKLLTGCSLQWKKTVDGFSASNDPKLCHSTPESVPAAVSAHWRMELTADQLGLSEQAFDSDGTLVYGTEVEPFIRLRKRSNSQL